LLTFPQAIHRTSTAAERNLDLEKKMIKEARNLSAARKLGAATISKEDVLDSEQVLLVSCYQYIEISNISVTEKFAGQ
jgi:hypothetical protein